MDGFQKMMLSIGAVVLIGLIVISSLAFSIIGVLFYHLTGGVIGTPPPKPKAPPPIIVRVGEMMLIGNASYADKAEFQVAGNRYGGVLVYTNYSPVPLRYLAPESAFGPHLWYGLNITNTLNVSIVQIVIASFGVVHIGGTNLSYVAPAYGLPMPFGTPWYWNGSGGEQNISGIMWVNYEIANVTIPAHARNFLVLNSTSLYNTIPIYFKLSNGSMIKEELTDIPDISF